MCLSIEEEKNCLSEICKNCKKILGDAVPCNIPGYAEKCLTDIILSID